MNKFIGCLLWGTLQGLLGNMVLINLLLYFDAKIIYGEPGTSMSRLVSFVVIAIVTACVYHLVKSLMYRVRKLFVDIRFKPVPKTA